MQSALHNENVNMETEIAELKKRLSAVRRPLQCIQVELPVATGDDVMPDIDISILREKCKLMQAQIANMNKDTLLTLPDGEDVEFHALIEDLLKRTAEYRECSVFLNVQQQQIKEDCNREEKVNEELKAVVSAAEMKLQETIHEKHSKSDVYKRLQAKCSKVDTVNNRRQEQMGSFLDEHYPLPDQAAFTKVKKKISVMGGEDTRLMRLQDLIPVKDIVKELMTSCIERPNDPYLETDHRYWPPYVDLLLQCDIALRHPVDAKRIKLMPFHL